MSNYNVDTLENKIVVEAQEAIKGLQNIIGYVNQSKAAVDSIKGATGLKSLSSQAKQATSNLTKMQFVSKTLKNTFNFTGLIYGFKRILGFLTGTISNSIDYIETLNLFEVSMGKVLDQYGNLDVVSSKYYTKALKFQNELNEAFGTNIEETMRYQALYNQMTKSMGINDGASYMISENLTKLGIDLASLFNKDEADTMEALRAGVLAGQTKPLRNYGLDVTQQTLSPLLNELGIDRSVKQLSQAEKMILRYIAVLRQASNAHGDFAETIESPANQLKVFKQQLAELKTAVGNLFQGMLGQILPYINAIVMVIKELIKVVANLFGFKVSSSNSNLADITGVEELESGLGGASGKAKELKAQLMGFDEINNITTDTGSGGGGGGVSSTGIDNKLLDAMKDYDNLMGQVQMKATKIRDKIMEWLGFSKKINPLTGEINWEFTGLSKGAKKILGILGSIIGLGLLAKIIKITGSIRNLITILKTGEATGLTPFSSGLLGIKNAFSSVKTWIGIGVDNFKSLRAAGYGVSESLKTTASGMMSLVPTALKVTAGIAGLAVSFYGAYDAMYDYSTGAKSAGEATGQLALSIGGATASGALLGSSFGPWGAAIGAVTGAVVAGGSALVGYLSEARKLEENFEESNKLITENVTAWKEHKESVQDSLNAQLGEVAYTENLIHELEGLVDANGKVTEGYETRAEFILGRVNEAYDTEYKLIDGAIDGYEEMKESIYSVIEAKKAEILLSANEDLYTKAIQNRAQSYKDYQTATENLSTAQEELTELANTWGFSIEDIEAKNAKYYRGLGLMGSAIKELEFDKLVEVYEEQKTKLEEAEQVWSETNRTIIDWENLKTATLTGNQEEIDKAMKAITNTYETESGKQTLTLEEELKMQKDIYDEGVKYYNEKGIEITNDMDKNLKSGYDLVVKNLVDTTKTVKELTPDQKDAWKFLASSSVEEYGTALAELEPTLSQEIQDMTGVMISETPEVERLASEMGTKMVDNLENNAEMRQQAVDSVKSYLQGMSDKEQKKFLKSVGIENADEVVKGLKEGNLSEDVGVDILKGLQKGLKNNYWQGQTLSTASSFASNVLGKFKKTFGIQSPSKKTRQFGLYLLEGLGIGINNGEKHVLKTVSAFSNEVLEEFSAPLNLIKNGISVEKNGIAIDTNQFINYGEVEGNINSKLNLNSNLGQIPNLVYNAVIQGMKNSSIQVDIEAKTEEGVIVEKASQGFKDYVTQTGELPFPVPV